jgi:hypothetical protein
MVETANILDDEAVIIGRMVETANIVDDEAV